MIKPVLIAICCCGLPLLLGACKVGSDEGQQTTTSSGTQAAVAMTPQGQLAKPLLATGMNPGSDTSSASHPEAYYLLLHGLNAAGQSVTHSYEFQKNVKRQGDRSVQLIWFEPNRAVDGGCLQGLSGYALEYGRQPGTYDTSLTFDLASRDMTCTTVGTTECGDVRECRYNLTL